MTAFPWSPAWFAIDENTPVILVNEVVDGTQVFPHVGGESSAREQRRPEGQDRPREPSLEALPSPSEYR